MNQAYFRIAVHACIMDGKGHFSVNVGNSNMKPPKQYANVKFLE